MIIFFALIAHRAFPFRKSPFVNFWLMFYLVSMYLVGLIFVFKMDFRNHYINETYDILLETPDVPHSFAFKSVILIHLVVLIVFCIEKIMNSLLL